VIKVGECVDVAHIDVRFGPLLPVMRMAARAEIKHRAKFLALLLFDYL
jgi:hypothetical protein